MSRIPRKAKVGLVVALAAVLVGTPAGVGFAAYQQDASMRGLLPAGTEIGGVDVSKLDRSAAVAKVKAHAERDLDRKATITVGGRTYSTTLRRLGVRSDAEQAVERAYDATDDGNWLTRAWDRLTDGTDAPREDVTVTSYDPKKLDAIVRRAAKDAAVAPVEADVRSDAGWLAFTEGRFGRVLDTKAALAALKASLKDSKARDVPLTEVSPERSRIDTAVLVRLGENKLYLYQGGRITRTYGVATGAPEFPTPTGEFEVTLKRFLPTWVNPWSKWSMNEPATIGPGPNNPLGTRALNISAPGIRIHGTPADKSIGYSVSHGCIRMHMPDVEALYPLVPQGAPVFIVRVKPDRLPGTPLPNDEASAADGG